MVMVMKITITVVCLLRQFSAGYCGQGQDVPSLFFLQADFKGALRHIFILKRRLI